MLVPTWIIWTVAIVFGIPFALFLMLCLVVGVLWVLDSMGFQL